MTLRHRTSQPAVKPIKRGLVAISGFTRMQLVSVIVGIVGLVILSLIPWVRSGMSRAHRISCVSNLKNIGLANRIWATDHGDFAWRISTNDGGTMEYLQADLGGQNWTFIHMLVLSNELSTPMILVCANDDPRDDEPYDAPARSRAQNWEDFRRLGPPVANQHLSYFVGISASEDSPNTLLGGDRNLTDPTISGSQPSIWRGTDFDSGRAVITGIQATNQFHTNTAWGFTPKRHGGQGNIVLGDGSVQQVTSERLREYVRGAYVETNGPIHLLLPNFQR